MKKSYLKSDRAEDVHLARRVMHVVATNEGTGGDQLASVASMTPEQISYPGLMSPTRQSPLAQRAIQAMATDEGTCDKQGGVSIMTPEYAPYPGFTSPTRSTPSAPLTMETLHSHEQPVWNRGQQFGMQWPTQWPKQDKEIKLPEWGTLHPDFGGVNKKDGTALIRARWSDDELDYIAKWYVFKKQQQPWMTHIARMVTKCHAAILVDPMAVPIFHRLHINDPTKFKNGFESANKKGMIGKF